MRRMVALAIAAALLLPPRLAAGGPVLCPFRRLTGLPCPACGLTRSWTAALHGRPGASLRFHPLGIVTLAVAAAYAAHADERTGPVPGRQGERPGDAWQVLAAGWVLIWLARVAREARRGR